MSVGDNYLYLLSFVLLSTLGHLGWFSARSL